MTRWLLIPLVLVAALGITVATPTPALAKGATSVTVTGPGLGPRSFGYTRAGHDVDLGTLAEASGIYGIFGSGRFVERPTLSKAELGPRYVLTWHQDRPVMAVSHVYPFARGGAWAHVPARQQLWGHTLHSGWWKGGRALERALVRLGADAPEPPVEPVAAAVSGTAPPTTTPPGDSPLVAVSIVGAGLAMVAAGWAFARRRATG